MTSGRDWPRRCLSLRPQDKISPPRPWAGLVENSPDRGCDQGGGELSLSGRWVCGGGGSRGAQPHPGFLVHADRKPSGPREECHAGLPHGSAPSLSPGWGPGTETPEPFVETSQALPDASAPAGKRTVHTAFPASAALRPDTPGLFQMRCSLRPARSAFSIHASSCFLRGALLNSIP